MAIAKDTEAKILRYHFVEKWRTGTIATQRLAGVINQVDVVVGQSSSPLHLGSLTECPVVTWTGINSDAVAPRYEKFWNPFGT